MKINLLLFFMLNALLFASCESEFAPKPKGYFRIDLPKKTYVVFDSLYPFSFQYPSYSKVLPYKGSIESKYWLNVEFPAQRATLHLSYFEVKNDLNKHLEESRTLAYKHTVKAEAIDENLVSIPDNNVYGTVYEIRGNAASTLQFFLTDSSKHFLRGALYFNVPPNADSLAPVNNFINKDVEKLISTLVWK